jgi:peptide/nickel transport system permease protein
MASYIARRLILLPVAAFGVTVLIFSLLQFLAPEMRAATFITDPRQLNAIGAIVRKYGLDQPVHIQYANWLREVFRGNLGWSQTARLPVSGAITAFFPATLELTLWSFVPIMLLGVWMGTAAAVHRDKMIDHLSRVFSISFRSLPSFVWGLLILMVTYGRFNWFPPGRLSLEADLFVRTGQFRFFTQLLTVDALLNGKFWIFLDALRHLAGPVLTLTIISIALLVRVTRSSMLEVLRQDYVRTARAKGLAEATVIDKHARKNALIPVITLSSLTFVGLLGGVVITETVFNFPGIGRWGAYAAQQLDIPGVTGFGLFFAVLTVLGNLAADILYAYFDPRIRLQ